MTASMAWVPLLVLWMFAVIVLPMLLVLVLWGLAAVAGRAFVSVIVTRFAVAVTPRCRLATAAWGAAAGYACFLGGSVAFAVAEREPLSVVVRGWPFVVAAVSGGLTNLPVSRAADSR